jgi:hypothetical protein
MRADRGEKIVSQDGVLELQALPFQAGEVVEAIVLSRGEKMYETHTLLLEGKVLRYENPPESVAQSDWEVLA